MTNTKRTQLHVIEAGDTVNVLRTDYGWDGISGPAEVIKVDGNELYVSMIQQNWEGWFHLQRIKR